MDSSSETRFALGPDAMPREPVIQEPLIPARTRPVTASPASRAPRTWRPAGTTPLSPSPRPATARRASPRSPKPWDAVPGALPSYYEYLAPSRWKDAKLDESARLASASRLHEDALRRQKLRREAETAKPPVTRWSGRRVPKETVDAAYDRFASQADEHTVKRRSMYEDQERPQTGTIRYQGHHEGFVGVLSPTKKLPVVDRDAGLLKQYYARGATTAAHKAERLEKFLLLQADVTDKERRLLGLDDVPPVPDASELSRMAAENVEARRALKPARAANVAEAKAKARENAKAYEEARAEKEAANARAMAERLAAQRLERLTFDAERQKRLRLNARKARREARREEKKNLKQLEALRSKFEKAALERREETKALDAARAEEEKARVAYARNKRKQEYLAAKKRQEKFAAMMDPANDAGSVLVMETRRHTRECDARRRDAREEAARKRREQRDAFRAATAKQRAFVEEVERKETERIQKTLAEYKDRALEAAKRAEEAAKRARKMRRESGTLVKRKKKKKPPSGNEEAGEGAAAPSEK